MKRETTIILNENEIKEIIANEYGVDIENVELFVWHNGSESIVEAEVTGEDI